MHGDVAAEVRRLGAAGAVVIIITAGVGSVGQEVEVVVVVGTALRRARAAGLRLAPRAVLKDGGDGEGKEASAQADDAAHRVPVTGGDRRRAPPQLGPEVDGGVSNTDRPRSEGSTCSPP